MFTRTIYSSHDKSPVFIVSYEVIGMNTLLVKVSLRKEDFKVFDFKYSKETGLQPNGNYETQSGWFYIILGELYLLIEKYKAIIELFINRKRWSKF